MGASLAKARRCEKNNRATESSFPSMIAGGSPKGGCGNKDMANADWRSRQDKLYIRTRAGRECNNSPEKKRKGEAERDERNGVKVSGSQGHAPCTYPVSTTAAPRATISCLRSDETCPASCHGDRSGCIVVYMRRSKTLPLRSNLRGPCSVMACIGNITYRSSTLPTVMPVYPAMAACTAS